MFAVIVSGGKQHLVREGESLKVEKLELEVGGVLDFDVLMVAEDDGSMVKVGKPTVKGASVTATVLEQGRAKKVSVIKFKSKVRYRRNVGHRQPFTKLSIDKIVA